MQGALLAFQEHQIRENPLAEDASCSRLDIRPFHALHFAQRRARRPFLAVEQRKHKLLALIRGQRLDFFEQINRTHNVIMLSFSSGGKQPNSRLRNCF